MRLQYRKMALGAVVAVATAAVAISIASASTTTITPAGDNMLATSGNVVFLIGGEDPVTCTLAQTGGTMPSPAQASMTLDLPFFQDIGGSPCTGKRENEQSSTEAIVTTGGPWTLTAATLTSGSIKLSEKDEIAIKWRGCTLFNEGPVTLPVTFAPGEKGPQLKYTKSVLTIAEDENFPVKVSGTCPFEEPGGKSYMRISAKFVVNDGTHLNESVKF